MTEYTRPATWDDVLVARNEAPCAARAAVRMSVESGGDAQGAGVGDGFAQQIEQRCVDTRVLDAGGSEEQFHDGSPKAGRMGQSEERRMRSPGTDIAMESCCAACGAAPFL